jgi:hypothetical protein
MAKGSKLKAVPYRCIEPDSDIGKPMYALLRQLLEAHHKDLWNQNARIALAWALSWKPDVDGREVLGKCKKASDLDREFVAFDFVIVLNKWFWTSPNTSEIQRRALLDHELMHAAVAYDDAGEPKRDVKGRTVFRIRKHDLEEFSAIAERYGSYKRDIEHFARSLRKAERATSGTWVSYSQLSETLREIGITVEPARAKLLSDHERREVMTWALLRQAAGEKVNLEYSQTAPTCLRELVNGGEMSAPPPTH